MPYGGISRSRRMQILHKKKRGGDKKKQPKNGILKINVYLCIIIAVIKYLYSIKNQNVMAKIQNSKTDWVGILEVISFVISAAIEVVKKWQEKEYIEEVKAETKGKESQNTTENK